MSWLRECPREDLPRFGLWRSMQVVSRDVSNGKREEEHTGCRQIIGGLQQAGDRREGTLALVFHRRRQRSLGGAYVGGWRGHGDGEVGIGRGLQGRWRGVVGDHTREVHDVGPFTERGLSEGAHADGDPENVKQKTGPEDEKGGNVCMYMQCSTVGDAR